MFRLKPRKKCTFITLEASEIRQGTVKTQCLGSAQLQCRSKSRCGLKKSQMICILGDRKFPYWKPRKVTVSQVPPAFPQGFICLCTVSLFS